MDNATIHGKHSGLVSTGYSTNTLIEYNATNQENATTHDTLHTNYCVAIIN